MWIREIYGKPNLSTEEIAIRNKMECGMDLIICDSAEPRLINEIKQEGCEHKPTIKRQGVY